MAFRILLVALGALFSLASRLSEGFRRAITRRVVFEITTDDGVAHHFVFADHAVSSHPGRAPSADCALRFASAIEGIRTLVSRHTIGHLLRGIEEGTIRVDGNPFQLLWFYDLSQRVVPLGEQVRWPTPPGAYLAPSTSVVWAGRITREPVAEALDPGWEAAARQRAKLKMLRVAAGEPTLEF